VSWKKNGSQKMRKKAGKKENGGKFLRRDFDNKQNRIAEQNNVALPFLSFFFFFSFFSSSPVLPTRKLLF